MVLNWGEPRIETLRAVFPAQEYGTLDYSLYFSNNVDSTFGQGEIAYYGMPTKEYKIHSAKLGVLSEHDDPAKEISGTDLTFAGEKTKVVAPHETFWSDPLSFTVNEGEVLVFEWTVEYTLIPATVANSLYPAYYYNTKSKQFRQLTEVPLPDLRRTSQ